MSEWAQFEDKAEAKGYAQISNALLRCPRISLQAKGFYALLKSYAWQDPSTFPGVKRLREDTGASDNTLKKYRDELVSAELLEVKRRGRGQTNLYIFKSVSKFLESHTGAKQESHMGTDQESHTGANNEDSVNEDSEDNSPKGAEAPEEGKEYPAKAMTTLTVDRTRERGFEPSPKQIANWGTGWARYLYVEDGKPPEPEEAFNVLDEIVQCAAGNRGKTRYWISVKDALSRLDNVHQLPTKKEKTWVDSEGYTVVNGMRMV